VVVYSSRVVWHALGDGVLSRFGGHSLCLLSACRCHVSLAIMTEAVERHGC
jgi:hypothetical protein